LNELTVLGSISIARTFFIYLPFECWAEGMLGHVEWAEGMLGHVE
jgi:hypothetical protein